MICLGIESTAHTFGVGIMKDEEILANEKATFTTKTGGMIPDEVATHHNNVKEDILNKALKSANLKIDQINLLSVAVAPGLSPCLLVGLRFAKHLATEHNLPLVPVNHSVAHLTIGDLICKAKDPVYLYVSGPNTQIIARSDRYRIFGETLDLGLGNMLDKFAREIKLGFPGGPKIEQLAKQGEYVELPYSVKGMDVSFTGMLTNALKLFQQGEKVENLCFSLQETAFAMLAEVAERAMAHTEKNELLLIGGVAANERLKEMLNIMCKERNATFHAVPLEYSGDQGVMIAWQGILQKDKTILPEDADIRPYERIDEVENE